METYKVNKGDSVVRLDIAVKDYPVLDENWQCISYLYTEFRQSSIPVISKVINSNTDLSGFTVKFEASDLDISTIIAGRTYDWITVISNATIDYKKTIKNKLEISFGS